MGGGGRGRCSRGRLSHEGRLAPISYYRCGHIIPGYFPYRIGPSIAAEKMSQQLILTKLAKTANIDETMRQMEINMQITATELKNRLGQYLDAAETDPVIVEKSGRVKSVLISNTMYEKFLAYEDAYWASKARQAEKEGYIGAKASEDLLKMN